MGSGYTFTIVIKIVMLFYLGTEDVESEFIVLCIEKSKHKLDPFLESNLKIPCTLRDWQSRHPRSGPSGPRALQ